ncbi:hypothetical protein AB6A40_003311 [Gnathostoma spinigerum]|uniref:Calx-beta domain-containing protein n=1 Tax=Gnathostoma spinigerum TaxID=75299 RepID=A0ABD6EBH9_9BILA
MSISNGSVNDVNGNEQCPDGLLIPAMSTSFGAGLVYLLGLFYCFLGIAIAADVFMCSIENITSATWKVKLSRTKKKRLVAEEIALNENLKESAEVRIWNPTVANLTLMALGSSAPEILLSIIEIVGNGFYAGDLGPGTIVGSAAFNLFCISAICVVCIKSPNVRRIQDFAVFGVTSVFSCFAYIWLIIILVVISPNVVEVWEAAITLAFFIVLVITAYFVDIKVWKKRKANLQEELMAEYEDKAEKVKSEDLETTLKRFQQEVALENEARAIAAITPDIQTIKNCSRQLSRTYPTLTSDEQAKLLAYHLKKNELHDRLYYRIQAARRMAAATKKLDAQKEVQRLLSRADQADKKEAISYNSIEWSARVYSVEVGSNTVTLFVVRHGKLDEAIKFRYTTVNGVAKKDLHFLSKSGSMQFEIGESRKEVHIDLVPNAEWKPKHVFYVHLKLEGNGGTTTSFKLGPTSIALVRKPDDSISFIGEPMVEFVRSGYVVKESAGHVRAFVTRRGRHDARRFSVKYETNGITAKADIDYVAIANNTLEFEGNEYEKYIDVRIIDDKQEEKDETFDIHLLSATSDVTIGPKRRAVITIVCDDNVLKNIADIRKLIPYYLDKMTPGKDSWREQIVQASCVNAGDVANATIDDCLMHAVAFPWKIAVALLPPPRILRGWVCFLISLFLIGLITAVVGDLARIFGCMVGLKDTVTAITLVALGTSLPDTFASKIAAQNEPTADNAVGNITGSNSVNVFLGLGLPWLIAAIFWQTKQKVFIVEAGTLGFSVIIFMALSFLCLGLFVIRRFMKFFGSAELGGPLVPKLLTGFVFFFLWVIYVSLSTLQAYDIIRL